MRAPGVWHDGTAQLHGRRDVPTSGSTDVLGLHLVKGSQVLVQRIGVQLQHEALLPRLKEGVALDRYSSFDPRPAPWRPLL